MPFVRSDSGKTFSVQDIAGDALFLVQSKQYTYKEWVNDLSVPYIALFVVAAGASVGTIVAKVVLFVQKSRSRRRASARADAPIPTTITLVGAAHEELLAKLDQKIESNRLHQRRAYVERFNAGASVCSV